MMLTSGRLLLLMKLVDCERVEKRGEVFDAAEAYSNMNNGKSGLVVLNVMDQIEAELDELDSLYEDLSTMLLDSAERGGMKTTGG